MSDVAQLLRDLVDPDDCWFDHNGGCQAHGYLSLQPGELCPHAEAKQWLAEHDEAAVGLRVQTDVDADSGWEPAKWHELTSDTDEGDPIGDTIRLTFEDGTVLVGRLTVGSFGAGHHQICRMQTAFSGDTYVWPHGAKLERSAASLLSPKEGHKEP